MKKIFAFVCAALMLVSATACGNQATFPHRSLFSEEIMNNNQAVKEFNGWINDLSTFPVDFVYDDVHYTGFHPILFREIDRVVKEEELKTSITITLRRTDTFAVRLETAVYPAYNAYEWTVHFYNPSTNQNSGVLNTVNAVNLGFEGANPSLVGILGDHVNMYEPYDEDLTEKPVSFVSTEGRTSHVYFPYFNLETDDGGAMIALGWRGTWHASFTWDEEAEHTDIVAGGTVGLNTYLKPGESVRTPLMAFVRYFERNEDVATNAWRNWYIDCNMPRDTADTDEPVKPVISTFLAFDTGRHNSDGSIAEGHDSWKRSMDAYYDNGLVADYRWFDAGWYYNPYGQTVATDWWGTVGTWEMDKVKWPGDSFQQSVRYAKEHGTDTFVWFEPERVTHLAGMVNYDYKREWALSDHGDNNTYINNLGIKECLDWTFERIRNMMDEYLVDMYREDFNLNPGIFWTIGDGYQGENRNGITENLYVQGHYELWDRIIAFCAETGRKTYVDSCASGGGCNDLESMRRGVPFLRSDSDRTTTALRHAMHTRLVRWLPFTGVVAKESDGQLSNGVTDLYVMRASMAAHSGYQAAWYHDQATIDWEALKQGQTEWREISRYFYNEFYVLTPYRAVDDNVNWTSYMYFDPEDNSGVVQAFRPNDSEEATYTVRLRGLDPESYYRVRDLDGVNSVESVKGSELMGDGLTFTTTSARTAIICYLEPVA